MTTPEEREAILEAEGWKKTAGVWRRRAVANASAWKRKAIEARAKVESLEEAIETITDERDEARKQVAKFERLLGGDAVTAEEVRDLRVKLETAHKALANAEHGAREAGKRMSKALETADKAMAAKYRAETLRAEHVEKVTREIVEPNRRQLRILAARLGVNPQEAASMKDDALGALLDRKLCELQKRAGDV